MALAETTDTVIYGGRALVHFHEKLHRYSVSVPSLEKWRIPQPGVTTILSIRDKSGPLCGWAVNQCEVFGQQRVAENKRSWMPNEEVLATLRQMKSHYRNVKAQAAEIGIIVHDYLHATLLAKQNSAGGPARPVLSELVSPQMLTQANSAIDAGLEFFEKHRLIPLTMERPVWSPSRGYIGTDDFIGLVDDELAVVDYKTSKQLYSEIWMQTAAYQAAYVEENPDSRRQFVCRWGVNTGKDGKLTAVRRPNDKTFESDLGAFLAFYQGWHWDRVENGGKPVEVIGSLNNVQIPDEEEW